MRGNDVYVMGVDAGTQGVRAALFDLSGNIASLSSESYPTYYPEPGKAEQDINEIWQATVLAVRDCLHKAGVKKGEVVGICFDGTSSTVIPVKSDGSPLRNAILWMDNRAVKEVEEINVTGHPVLMYAGNADSVEWMVPKAMWLKRNEPEIYNAADLIIEPTDWFAHKLTGRWTASVCNATCKWNYVRPEGGWNSDFFHAINMEDLIDKWPQDVLYMSEYVDRLLPQVAEELGLMPGIAVAQGGIDAHIGMYGLNVVTPGRMALILGTSAVYLVLSEKPRFAPGLWGPYPEAVVPGLWLLEGGQISAGSLIKWFKDNCGFEAVQKGEEFGVSPYQIIDEQASCVPLGAEGLVMLDHWQGNRTPLRDPLSRGVLAGLSLHHTSAHIARSLYEGISFGARHITDTFSECGEEIKEIFACGGGTKSRLWLKILSSVCGVPVALTHTTESVCLGGAICAAVAAGYYEDIKEACARMVRVKEVIEPDLSWNREYEFYYDKYLKIYQGLQDVLHDLTWKSLKGGDGKEL